MSIDFSSLEIEKLTVDERYELLDMIFDSIPDDADTSQLSERGLTELKARRAVVAANPALKHPRKPQGEAAST